MREVPLYAAYHVFEEDSVSSSDYTESEISFHKTGYIDVKEAHQKSKPLSSSSYTTILGGI